mmetsp:Transcript_39998/g.80172  ORF Transcript_39998/g.80172 Transcript_39998/m.80172 type:complete len:235 (+) Transcript_39998:175-879(+)
MARQGECPDPPHGRLLPNALLPQTDMLNVGCQWTRPPTQGVTTPNGGDGTIGSCEVVATVPRHHCGAKPAAHLADRSRADAALVGAVVARLVGEQPSAHALGHARLVAGGHGKIEVGGGELRRLPSPLLLALGLCRLAHASGELGELPVPPQKLAIGWPQQDSNVGRAEYRYMDSKRTNGRVQVFVRRPKAAGSSWHALGVPRQLVPLAKAVLAAAEPTCTPPVARTQLNHFWL